LGPKGGGGGGSETGGPNGLGGEYKLVNVATSFCAVAFKNAPPNSAPPFGNGWLFAAMARTTAGFAGKKGELVEKVGSISMVRGSRSTRLPVPGLRATSANAVLVCCPPTCRTDSGGDGGSGGEGGGAVKFGGPPVSTSARTGLGISGAAGLGGLGLKTVSSPAKKENLATRGRATFGLGEANVTQLPNSPPTKISLTLAGLTLTAMALMGPSNPLKKLVKKPTEKLKKSPSVGKNATLRHSNEGGGGNGPP